MRNDLMYEVGVEFIDGEYGTLGIEAENYGHALALAEAEPHVLRATMVYGTIDQRPQEFLAW